MKRIALATAIVLVLLVAVFVVFFTASRYRVDDQGYVTSLHDFVFMVHSHNQEAFALDVPALTHRGYEKIMAHARRTSHREVRDRVVWSVTRWGDAVAPKLTGELDARVEPGRLVAAVNALAALHHTPAVPALTVLLARTRDDRWLQVQLIDAVGPLGPDAAPMLLDAYRHHDTKGESQPYSLLDALGKSGGATEFLLAELDDATSVERIRELAWPLAFTGDPRAARALMELLHHPSLGVRQRARDAMSQSMGEAAIEPAVDLLETETDDYVRNWVLGSILNSGHAGRSDRAMSLMARLIDDPAVSSRARYALAWTRSERAVGIFVDGADRFPPSWLLEHLDIFGEAGLPIAERLLQSDNLQVRRATILALGDLRSSATAPLLQEALRDPDRYNRRYAREALELTDLYALGESAGAWLSEETGRTVGPARIPTRRGVRVAVASLKFVHWVGLGVSVLVALLLLTGSLRAFEPFKFALVLQFLFIEGIVGDFFFFTSPTSYRWATASRLGLLLGLLFLRDDPLPGEVRGRVERLAVRSLWVLAPLLLLVGAPLVGEALRLSLRDFSMMKWAGLLLVLTAFLIVEQAFVPWHAFPRGGRVERAMTLMISSALVAVVAAALYRYASLVPDPNRRALAAWLFLPLVIALIFHFAKARLFEAPAARPVVEKRYPDSLDVVDDGESVLIKLRPGHRHPSLPLLAFGVTFLGGSWALLEWVDVVSGGGPALFLMLTFAVFGTAIGSLIVSSVFSSFTIQVRSGAMRWASTFWGGALGRSRWYRKLRLPADRKVLGLTPTESRFITSLLCVLIMVAAASTPRAALAVEHPSDYVRVLESNLPEQWDEAVVGLLGDEENLPMESVSSILRRVGELTPGTRLALARALAKEGWHPRVLETLWTWAHVEDPSFRSTAMASLLSLRCPGAMDAFRDLILEGSPERVEALRSLVSTFEFWEELLDEPHRGVLDPVIESSNGTPAEIFDRRYLFVSETLLRSRDPNEREEAAGVLRYRDTPGMRRVAPELFPNPPSKEGAHETASAQDNGLRAAVLAALVGAAALCGGILFLWGFRLTALAVRIRNRPISKVRSIALGPVALVGTVEAAGDPMSHPVTGEECVYYIDADRKRSDARFYLCDDTGRVLIAPKSAAIFSDDGVLVVGERIHVVGLASRRANGELVVRADVTRPPLYVRVVQRLVNLLIGHETGVTKMLFSDPRRCFWIWDDMDRRPLSSGTEVLWLAAGVVLAGAWMVVFALAAGGLLDADVVRAFAVAAER